MAPGADYGARRLEIRGEMVRTCSPRLAEKRTEGAHKRLSRALLSNLQPVFPCGLMPVKHEMPSVSPPEFTTLTHNNLLVARFFRWPMVMLLMIEGNCSCFASKPAHISGHLPPPEYGSAGARSWYQWHRLRDDSALPTTRPSRRPRDPPYQG